jgi:phosphoglycolate phosphatase-like HAD superfamily hydrolase
MTADGRTLLVLWDIDHTLIETRGVGRDIYERVFPVVTGQPLRDLAIVHGRTELDIMSDTLEMHGITATTGLVRQLAAALAAGYHDAAAELAERGRVLPGAREALRAFAAEPGIWQSVLTGNTTEIARIKVRAFGLDPYLDLGIGAYGDDHRDRAQLVAIGRERCARKHGVPVEASQVILIGDTPADVSAALTAGARIIAVAAGKYTSSDLAEAGAASPLTTLADLPQLRRAISATR